MKKIIALACFFSLVFALRGQEDIRFGFQMSPSFAWMTTNTGNINSSGTNLGLKLGMVGEFYFRENYAATLGLGFHFNSGGTLLYDHKGVYWPRTDLPPSLDTLPAGVKLKSSVQYLEIPVGLKMRTREFGYIRYFLEPALTIGLKTQSRGKVEGTGVKDEEKYNIRREINGLNLSWGVGGGIEYSISENTSLIAGLGFQIGFTDATDDDRRKVYFDPDRLEYRREDSKASVNAITLRLGIMF